MTVEGQTDIWGGVEGPVPHGERGYSRTSTARVQAHRARNRAEAEAEQARWEAELAERYGPPLDLALPGPVQARAIADWAEARLVIPPGHAREGEPFVLPSYAVEWFGGALGERHTSLISTARKNAKSAICAVLLLAFLVGPIRRPGGRAAIASVDRAKAGELRIQIQGIAEASSLEGLTWRRYGFPSVESVFGVAVDVLAAGSTSGHASGFDYVLIDETGLLTERDREYLTGLTGSVSARRGRVLHISVVGPGPFVPELVEDPTVFSTVFAAPPDTTDLMDRRAWAAANPGLASRIKSVEYLREKAESALAVPANAPGFRTYELNLPTAPDRIPIVNPHDWTRCETEDLPPREGVCVLGIDLGGSASMTAAAACWPATGRLELWCAYPPSPALEDRARADGKPPNLYSRAVERGELEVLGDPGQRTTPVGPFLARVAARLTGSRVVTAAADWYRRSEAQDALLAAGVRWPVEFRRVGAGPAGGEDVRAFQRAVLTGWLRCVPHLLMRDAVAFSTLHFDRNDNPGLEKTTSVQRIDVLQGAVIAVGLAERRRARPDSGMRLPSAAALLG